MSRAGRFSQVKFDSIRFTLLEIINLLADSIRHRRLLLSFYVKIEYIICIPLFYLLYYRLVFFTKSAAKETETRNRHKLRSTSVGPL